MLTRWWVMTGVKLVEVVKANDVAALEQQLASVRRDRAEVLRWRAEEIDKLEQERDHLRRELDAIYQVVGRNARSSSCTATHVHDLVEQLRARVAEVVEALTWIGSHAVAQGNHTTEIAVLNAIRAKAEAVLGSDKEKRG